MKYLRDVTKQANQAQKSKGTTVSTDDDINTITDTKLNDNSHSKSQVDEYTNDIPKLNILLIGLSYNRDIVKQFENNGDIHHISECIDVETGKQIEAAVARDTYRSYVMSKMYEMVKIYTVNKCEDKVRSCNNDKDPYIISLNVCNCKFSKLSMTKKWSFNEIYVDTFRMQKLYVM